MFQNQPPIDFGPSYFQKWTSGIKGGGSGFNLFIPIKTQDRGLVILDSVYFRGKVTKLEIIEDKTILFVGRFETEFNQKPDIIMSDNPNEEYGNKSSILLQKIPFDLKDSECVVSYKDGNDTKYFKIGNITEKQPENYPSTLPQKQ